MYSEADYEAFPAFATPEIHRVRLEAVVLQIKMLTGSAADPRAFGFIEPPKQETLEAAVTSLKQVGYFRVLPLHLPLLYHMCRTEFGQGSTAAVVLLWSCKPPSTMEAGGSAQTTDGEKQWACLNTLFSVMRQWHWLPARH